jgi:hypothetical protein
MSPKEEIRPKSDTSPATLNQDEERNLVKTGKKPFVEPTVSVSLNILDSTSFFQGSAAIDVADTV